MKILISIGTLGLGGAEKQAVWLANQLSSIHEVTLLTYHGGVREKDLSPNVHWETIFKNEFNDGSLSTFTADLMEPENSIFSQNDLSYLADTNEDFNSEPLLSRVATWRKRIKNFLRNSPRSLKIVSQIYSSIRLTIRITKKIFLFLYKLLCVACSMKYKVAAYLRRLVSWLTLSKVRQKVINQTFAFRRARKVIKKTKPDLIITFLFHDTLNVGLAGLLQIRRPKLFVGRRSPIGYGDSSRNLVHRLILRIIYKFSTLAVSNSAGNVMSALRDGLTEEKIVCIDNFVENHGSQLELNFSEETKFICIANFFEYKNHRNLIEAFGEINLGTTFQVTFVGEGPTRSEMIALCSELNLNAVFYTHDDQARIGTLEADFLVLPSFYEGSSNALLEGLAKGIPAIVTNVGHVPTLVKMGAPLLVSFGTDSKSLSTALDEGFRSKLRLRREAENFKTIVHKEFSEGKILQDWLKIIKSN